MSQSDTQTQARVVEIKPLVETRRMLNEADVADITKLERMKAKVAAMEKYLKPRITATIDAHGTGMLTVGKYQVDLKRASRFTASWKSLAHGLLDPLLIAEHVEAYTVESIIDRAKVVN